KPIPPAPVTIDVAPDTPAPVVVQYLVAQANITDITDELSDPTTVSPDVVAYGYTSEVYRATRPDGTQLAIKCIRCGPNCIEDTARELIIWSRLKHPNVLELSGLALFQNSLAMVSPWMEFNSVSSALENWPDLNRFRLCRQIAQAVGYIHNMNLVHGNIRGSSFFMGPDGTPKLTKFGHNIRHVPGSPLTNPSIRWMAPELFQDEAQKCCETDVFAMGVEIITGYAPFPDVRPDYTLPGGFVDRHEPRVPELETEPESPQAKAMLNLLHWCWRYEPCDRPTAQQVVLLMNSIAPS
ncbi:hypothetical protein FS749_016004, partial [Ceratobasidium sp. UAMH 11750]